MNVARLIAKKRDGGELTTDDIEYVIDGFAAGQLPDYQMSALAMAIFFQGLNFRETVDFTRLMRDSGRVMQWEPGRPKVDKHSTGGIGDKISIPLAPTLAACGLDVPMISGRGLGPTGGTLDKLESIAGFRCDLLLSEFQDVVQRAGCVISGAGAEIAPADKKLYALRDVTATVPSVGLITASILSKKLAEGLDALVLDVKWGSGAFMKTREEAVELASTLVRVASELGIKTTALLTDMNQPLGRMVGNAVEIEESIEILQGNGPDDVRRLTCELSAQLLVNTLVVDSHTEALTKIATALDDGSALERFEKMVGAQHGDLSRIEPRATGFDYPSKSEGFLAQVDCEKIGLAIIELGGGRRQLGDKIDFSVGLEVLKKIGDPVSIGEPIVKIFDRHEPGGNLLALLDEAFVIKNEPASKPDLIQQTITIENLVSE